MEPVETVLLFMDRINQHDADKLVELVTDDHEFVDSLGNTMRGRDSALKGWRGYFAFCPDYWLSHEEVFARGNQVAVIGSAGGTIAAGGQLLPENKWKIPAAWLAVVNNGKIQKWQVYADNKPVYDILGGIKKTS
jgi:ketosteroid isomerase-like protein